MSPFSRVLFSLFVNYNSFLFLQMSAPFNVPDDVLGQADLSKIPLFSGIVDGESLDYLEASTHPKSFSQRLTNNVSVMYLGGTLPCEQISPRFTFWWYLWYY